MRKWENLKMGKFENAKRLNGNKQRAICKRQLAKGNGQVRKCENVIMQNV